MERERVRGEVERAMGGGGEEGRDKGGEGGSGRISKGKCQYHPGRFDRSFMNCERSSRVSTYF